MSLSVERLKELRADAYDYGDMLVHAPEHTEFERGLLSLYFDTVKAFDELIAIKKIEPVAESKDAARYRYLRENAVYQYRNGPYLQWYLRRSRWDIDSADALDNAIDESISYRKQKNDSQKTKA